MKTMFLFLTAGAFCLCGCAGTPRKHAAVSTHAVQVSVDTAAQATRKASAHTMAANSALEKAMASSRELAASIDAMGPAGSDGAAGLGDSSPASKTKGVVLKKVAELQMALEVGRAELAETQSFLVQVEDSLADSTRRLEEVQQAAIKLEDALDAAQAGEKAAQQMRNFWRGWVWRLAVLSLALGLWIARKPLMRLLGGVL